MDSELVSRDIRVKVRAFADHLFASEVHDAWEAQFEWPEDFEATSYQSRDQFDGWSNSVVHLSGVSALRCNKLCDGVKGQHVSGAVTGSCDLLGGVGVDDVGGDHRFGLLQTGE